MADLINNSQLEKALVHIQNKQHQQALDILIPFVQENPKSEQAWLLLSFAVKDNQKKKYCLQQVLQLNPTNKRARDRLTKLQGLVPDEQIEKDSEFSQRKPATTSKKRKLPWYLIPTIVIILLAMGLITVTQIIPAFKKGDIDFQAIAIDQIEPATTEASQIITSQPTITPTKTPTLQWTESPTPTLPPPLPTREFESPQGSLAQQMDDIQNQVSTIRNLDIISDNPRYLVPQNKVYNVISPIFRENYTREDVRKQAIALQSLGLIDPTYDLYTHMLESLDEGLGGFFIPWTDELFVIGDDFSPIEQFVYAHEYTHALTDQHFHLEEIGVYPLCNFENDACLAITALVEGDATLLMYRWQQAYSSEEDIATIQEAKFAPIEEVITSNDFPPPYLIRDVYFKYADGRTFVEYLYEKGGWDLINQAYQELPSTTEQILHPEKYTNTELPKDVQLTSLDSLLDQSWEHITTSTLGQLMTEMVLAYSENYLHQIEPTKAITAAAGWGGDQYQVYYQSRTNQRLLVAMWEWDTIEDRDEFWEAISDYLNKRYQGRQSQETGNRCWVKINDHFSCIFKFNTSTLWITAPSMSLMTQILSKYPGFR